MATAASSVDTKTRQQFKKDLGNEHTILRNTGCGALGAFIAIIGSYKKQNPAVNQDPKHLTDTNLTLEGLRNVLRTADLRPVDSPSEQELRAVASDDRCVTGRFPKAMESLIMQGSGLLPQAAAALFKRWAESQGRNMQLGFVAPSHKTWIPEATHLDADTQVVWVGCDQEDGRTFSPVAPGKGVALEDPAAHVVPYNRDYLLASLGAGIGDWRLLQTRPLPRPMVPLGLENKEIASLWRKKAYRQLAATLCAESWRYLDKKDVMNDILLQAAHDTIKIRSNEKLGNTYTYTGMLNINTFTSDNMVNLVLKHMPSKTQKRDKALFATGASFSKLLNNGHLSSSGDNHVREMITKENTKKGKSTRRRDFKQTRFCGLYAGWWPDPARDDDVEPDSDGGNVEYDEEDDPLIAAVDAQKLADMASQVLAVQRPDRMAPVALVLTVLEGQLEEAGANLDAFKSLLLCRALKGAGDDKAEVARLLKMGNHFNVREHLADSD